VNGTDFGEMVIKVFLFYTSYIYISGCKDLCYNVFPSLQYVKQQPVRPVLNRKDTKPSTKEVSATARNVLDSTAPSTRRGKEREQPKAKKPTYLRKVIEKEKAAKKELREQGRGIPHDFDVMRQPGTDQSDHSNVPATNGEVIDTNTGQESLTTPTQQSPETTPTATPTNQSPEATPTYDIIPAPSTTPVSQPSPSNPTPSAVTEAGSAIQKRQVHGKRFREYCSHMVTDEINGAAEALLLDLVRFQDRAHLKDPIKARSKRRYVCGLREVYKHLEVGKLKCVIVPPNLDHIQSTGGIDERISAILSLCQSKLVPVVYAMSRRKLAIVLKKKFKIGCVGIFSYDGAEGHYRKLRKLIEEATELYQRVAHPMPPRGSTEDEISPTTNDPLLSGSGSDNSEEEGPIPEPKTGNGTQKTTTDALWDKYLPKKSVPTDPPTNTISQHVNSDVTSTSTNGYTAIEDDIVGSKRAESTYDSQLSTMSVEESGTAGTTSSLGRHAGDVPADGRVVSPSTTVFQWNINAAEFIPS
jgi:ribosomal protein L7Ae-like RNA K-turn-binding protein